MNTQDGRPKDTTGKERIEEGLQAFHLQQSPSATDGSHDRKERNHPLLIHIENSSQNRSFFLQQVKTTEEVRQGLFREVPSLFCEKLTICFFTAPMGSKERIPIQGNLGDITELYATVYLFKH